MKVLAIDLAYVGDSGWVLWDSEQTDPVARWGTWSIKGKGKKIDRTYNVITQIFDHVSRIVDELEPDVIAYEYTDWHRTLRPSDPKWQREYYIERNAQRTLGEAEAALICAIHAFGLDLRVIGIGANEAKKEFGAMKKKAAAELFSDEFPRFEFIRANTEKDGGYLRDGEKLVPHHASDAFVIAYVVARRLRIEELTNEV